MSLYFIKISILKIFINSHYSIIKFTYNFPILFIHILLLNFNLIKNKSIKYPCNPDIIHIYNRTFDELDIVFEKL